MRNINLDDYPLAKRFLEKNHLTIDDIERAIVLKIEELTLYQVIKSSINVGIAPLKKALSI